MKRTKFKNEYYGLGYYIDSRDFGFVRHGSNLQALLQSQGDIEFRIVQFTQQGLKTIYRYHNKLGWRKTS